MLAQSILAFAAAATVSATNLFGELQETIRIWEIPVANSFVTVSDYGGNITTFSLTASNGTYNLSKAFQTTDCAPNPSWLTVDIDRGLLFCMNEGLDSINGSLSSFTINHDGSLNHVKNETTISGPVNGVIYGNAAGQRAIALAHYTGSAVSSWLLQGSGKFELNQNIPYTLAQPGPNAARQDAPHEHEAITDPTGQYILVPDLGADLVRVYSWDETTLMLKELSPLQAAAGSGPRHAVFWNPYAVIGSGETYFYLVSELSSTVTSYTVTYLPNGGGLNFTEVFTSTTYGLLNLPEGNAPAEIHVTVRVLRATLHEQSANYFAARQSLPHHLQPQQHLLQPAPV